MWRFYTQLLPRFTHCICFCLFFGRIPIRGTARCGLAVCLPGPCLTTVIWRCRKNASQWQRSFQRKLHSHCLKFLRQRHVAVVRQGPVPRASISTLHRHAFSTLVMLKIFYETWKHISFFPTPEVNSWSSELVLWLLGTEATFRQFIRSPLLRSFTVMQWRVNSGLLCHLICVFWLLAFPDNAVNLIVNDTVEYILSQPVGE